MDLLSSLILIFLSSKSHGRNIMKRKRRKKMNIRTAIQPLPCVMKKGKKMMVHSPDWMDRVEARNMSKKPMKISVVPILISP